MSLSSDSSEGEAKSVGNSDEAGSVSEGTDERETYSSVSDDTSSESDNSLEGSNHAAE